MSVQAMAWVFDESTAMHGARLVLLAIANHHNKETGAAFPGYDLLAREARLSRSATIRAVDQLEREGHIIVTRPAPGRGRSNRYHIVGYEGSRNATPLEEVASDAERVASDARKGRVGATRTRLTMQPSGVDAEIERRRRAQAKIDEANEEREAAIAATVGAPPPSDLRSGLG